MFGIILLFEHLKSYRERSIHEQFVENTVWFNYQKFITQIQSTEISGMSSPNHPGLVKKVASVIVAQKTQRDSHCVFYYWVTPHIFSLLLKDKPIFLPFRPPPPPKPPPDENPPPEPEPEE